MFSLLILEVFNGWHICGNLLEFVDQQLEKWNNNKQTDYDGFKKKKMIYKHTAQ